MGQPTLLYPNTPYLSTAAVTASDSYAGTDADDVLTATEDSFWRPANTTGTKTLLIDLGEVRTLNSIGLVGEGMDGVTLTVKGDDNSGMTSPDTVVDAVTLSAPVNCGWEMFSSSISYRYVQLSFSTIGSAFRVAFVSLQNAASFALLADDWDPTGVSEGGSAQVSPTGLYLGAVQQRVMRELAMNFGQVSSSQYAPISAWAAQCVETFRPFVFVPDVDESAAFFGWLSSPTFSAPIETRSGLRRVGNLKLVTRAA